MNFYKRLAPHYDEMISFKPRLENERYIYKNIFKKFPAKKVLDAGCGSGFLSILLSQIGLSVIGCDNSQDMLIVARKNATFYNVKPEFIFSDFLSLATDIDGPFDAIFCVGNSFVHLLTVEHQLKALDNFNRLLTANGYLCLQILNYYRILAQRPEIFSVKKLNNKTIIRGYRYNES